MSKYEFLRTYFVLITNYHRDKLTEADRAACRERDLRLLLTEPGCPDSIKNKLSAIIFGSKHGNSVPTSA